MQPNHCLNCQNDLQDHYKFCPACGQTTHLHRINAAHLLHDSVHFFTHADKGIFFLIRHLATRPGHVAREYIQGQRKKYFSPVSFFFVVVGIYVFALTSFHTFEQVRSMEGAKKAIMRIQDRRVREKRLAVLERAEKVPRFVGRYSNLLSMVATPLAALIMFLVFIRSKYNYMEHLTANMYFVAFTHLPFILILAPIINLSKSSSVFFVCIIIYLLLETIYRSIAYYQFINKRGFRYFLHALGGSIAVTAFWSFFSRGLITMYISHGFWGLMK